MISYAVPFGFTFLIVFLIIPLILKIAVKYNFVDQPNNRKAHKKAVPLLGGVAIYFAFIISLWIWVDPLNIKIAITICSTLIVGIGFIDDYYKTKKRELSVRPKIIVQIIVGVVLFLSGIRIIGITSFYDEGMIIFSLGISLFITLVWTVGLMNMINFLDGMDGLASGIVIISSITLFFVSYVKGIEVTSFLSIILMGATIGFLVYNTHPAKIFLGDAGSLFLGFMLAVISIEGALKSATLLSIVMVTFIFGVPIFDTVIVFFNRIKNRRPIYLADRSHAHHRLLKKGYNQRQTVTIIYLISIIFSIISIIILFRIVF